MRQIVLDMETTGLDPEEGHRIIEIGVRGIDQPPPHRQYLSSHGHRKVSVADPLIGIFDCNPLAECVLSVQKANCLVALYEVAGKGRESTGKREY